MLLFCDGFDHYNNAAQKWTSVHAASPGSSGNLTGTQIGVGSVTVNNGGMLICQEASRTPGAQGIKMRSDFSGGSWLQKALPNSSTVIVGFAMMCPQSSGATAQILQFNDLSQQQVYITLEANGQISAYGWQAFSTRPLLGTSTASFQYSGVWSYFEVKVVFSTTTTGSVTIKKDGVTILNVTGVQTAYFGHAYANSIVLSTGNSNNGEELDFDDIYICDGTGTVNNDFLGDVHIAALVPSGPGSSTQFTKVGAATNWQAVSEIPPDQTSFVFDSTSGHKDMYTLTQLTRVGTVHGVQISSYAMKDAAGAVSVSHVANDGNTDMAGTAFSPGTSYSFCSTPFDQSPSGTPWTYTTVNSMQAGFQIN